MKKKDTYPLLTADEAARDICNGTTVGLSGFTGAGSVKAIPSAIARRAKAEHSKGNDYRIRVFTGASTGPLCDTVLTEADAISFRAPYQSSPKLRKQINSQEVEYVDVHLSHLTQQIEQGFFGKIDVAVIEATEVTAEGHIYLTTAVGNAPTFIQQADKIIIEINRHHNPRLREMTDIVLLPPRPRREPFHLATPLSKAGTPYAVADPRRIVGIVETDTEDGISPFTEPEATHKAIAGHLVDFIHHEIKAGRIPRELLPFQSGVGNVANAVISALGASKEIPPFYMYTEVFQEALVDLMKSGKLLGASTCSLTVTDQCLQEIYSDMDFFSPRIVLRPTEISNNPGIIRNLGVISMNTALEIDIYGNVNSTHVMGTRMMNGIGGSGDFTRNAYLSFFTCPSTAKNGLISSIVPMVSHCDHNEHSVQVVVTEQGLADLRGLGPVQRAKKIIENCAHPDYKLYLLDYLDSAGEGHIRHNLKRTFELHCNLLEYGYMLPQRK